ncbi:MAG: AI-2E family transporter [Fimbriimonadaceae bacterium]|nr:AI-2E family transporter [Fimbriimonadaceae bacterium]
MDGWRAWNTAWRILLWISLVIGALWFLWAVRAVLLPFVLAFLSAVIVEPAVEGLTRRRVKRPFAVVAVTVAFFGVLGLVAAWLATPVSQQVQVAQSAIQQAADSFASGSADDSMGQVDAVLARLSGFTEQFGFVLDRETIVTKFIEPRQEKIGAWLESFANGLFNAVTTMLSQAFGLVFVPIFVVMLLMDLHLFRKRLRDWFPPSIRESGMALIAEVGDVFKAYLRGISISVTLYVLMMMLVLALMGAPYFVLLSIIAGILYLIPVIGGMITSILVFTVIALSGQTGSSWFDVGSPVAYGACVVGALFVLGTSYDMLVNPRIVGKAVSLHPFFAVFVVFCGGALFGVPGMILAVPVAGATKVVLEKLLRLSTSSQDLVNLPAVPGRHRIAI